MTITLITATLNSGTTLGRCLDSALTEPIKPDEYILVDGGSTDGTLAVIDEAAGVYPQIDFRIIPQTEKTGIYGALNLGVEAAASDLVFILHSDDWYEPGTIETVLNVFSEHPEVDLVCGSAFFCYPDGHKTVRTPKPFWMFPFLMPVVHPACFVRKRVYDEIGLYDQNYQLSADYDFVYRCYSKGMNFLDLRTIGIDKPVVNMELGGSANQRRPIARRETCQIAEKYCPIPMLPKLAYLVRQLFEGKDRTGPMFE